MTQLTNQELIHLRREATHHKARADRLEIVLKIISKSKICPAVFTFMANAALEEGEIK